MVQGMSMERHIFIYNKDFAIVSGDYTCDHDIVANLGETWQDYLDGKYVMLNEEQTEFLDSYPTATPQEVWNMEISPLATASEILALVNEINDYDMSEEVNTFYVNGEAVWFSKEKRTALNNSLTIEETVKDTTTLWVNNTPYVMTVEAAKRMLVDIELYTIECYNNTQENIAKAKTLTLKEEVASFDITKGYPEKLNFNL